MLSARRLLHPFIGLGLFAILLGGLLLPSLGGAFAAQRGLAQGSMLLSGLAWAALLWIGLLAPGYLCGRRGALVVVLGALLLRAAVGLGDPLLSDDVHRYVWEGGLVTEGISPYAWSPDAPELASQRERWSGVYGRMNHRSVSAAYPPAAQAVFAGVTKLAGGPGADDGRRAVGAMRWAFASFDLGVLLLLLWRFRAQPGRAIVWGWSPLVALEFAGSAHFDSLGILLFLGALLCFERSLRFPGWGYVLLSLGMLVKFLPLLAFPFSTSNRRALLPAGVLLVLLFGLGFAPLVLFEGGLGGISSGVSQYALTWESFSLLFRPIEWPIEQFLEHGGDWTDARRWSRLTSMAILAAVALWAWRQRRGPIPASFLLIGAFLMLTPTLHPWYLTWLIPLLAFRPSLAWTWLLVIAPMLYWPLTEWQARAEWLEPAWLWPLVCIPFCVLLALEALRRGALPSEDALTSN